ncbi:MAG: alpha/beta hydrolase [Rhodobacteraceae bacterium]|nr:alpha/beta hydrolase [Paracoccaceae bacterium]
MKVRLRDIEVNYHKAGKGVPAVFIHGLAEDHRSWANLQGDLTGIESYAYDLRGHGRTSLGQPDNTLEQLGRDLIAFLENVTGPAACIGFSLGGTVVLWAAAKRPDLVTHAIVVGTSSKVGRAAVGFFQQRIGQLQDDRAMFDKGLASDTASQLVRQHADIDAVAAQRLAAVGDGGGYINAARAMIALADSSLTPLLADISVPVTVIGGEKDAFCPKKAADMICAELPDAAYHEIPDAGHLMSVDQPALYSATIQQAIRKGT